MREHGEVEAMPRHSAAEVGALLKRKGRWSLIEILFWVAAGATLFLLPERHLILNEIAIIGLFALSLDLILGYAGIVSLGHAAYFGLGAYVAGILSKLLVADPIAGLVAAAASAAGLGFITSFLVLRGADLTRLMVTLGVALVMGDREPRLVAHRRRGWIAGRHNGTALRIIRIRYLRHDRLRLQPRGDVRAVRRGSQDRRISVRSLLRSIRDNPLRARAIGIPVGHRLVAIYTLSAAYAGVAGALLAQTTQFVF